VKRLWPVLVAAALVVGFQASLAAPAAQAASGRSGACTTADDNAVTVVIDYQGLGGGTATYCASHLPAGATGLDALTAAGVAVTGTSQAGSAVACRLNGRPAADQTLTLPGGQAYQEQCVTMPPAGAYWSYWWANPGGSWTYNTQGLSLRPVVFGSYEGWSFALGGGIGQAPAPRVTPAPLVVPPPPPAETTAPVAPPPTQVAPPPVETTRASTTGPTGGQTPTGANQPASADTVPATDLPTTAGSTVTAGSAMTPASVFSPETVTTTPQATGTGQSGSTTPWGTIIGLSLVVVLAAAAGGVGWYRRRSSRRG